jgi:riboflavin synthase alpha subunit
VTLIPHTLAVTRLGSLSPGAKVNLEADLIAKHVANLLMPSPKAKRRKIPVRRQSRGR